MGDHRASIKIEMEFHGIKDKADMNINYCDSDGNGVDSRVTEFFQSVYERGMAEYNIDMIEYYERCDKAEIERKEKDELERLQKKYGNKDNPND